MTTQVELIQSEPDHITKEQANIYLRRTVGILEEDRVNICINVLSNFTSLYLFPGKIFKLLNGSNSKPRFDLCGFPEVANLI